MVVRSFSAKVMLFAAAIAGIFTLTGPAQSGQPHKNHSQLRSSNILPLNARPPVASQFTSVDGRRRDYRGDVRRPYAPRLNSVRYNSSQFETRHFRSPEFRAAQYRRWRDSPARLDPFGYDRARFGDRGPIVYNDDTLVYDEISQLPNIGTYIGGISAYPVPGNGIYFTSNNGSYGSGGYGYFGEEPVRAPDAMLAPKARIITVTANNADEGCSFEAGVCVIRP